MEIRIVSLSVACYAYKTRNHVDAYIGDLESYTLSEDHLDREYKKEEEEEEEEEAEEDEDDTDYIPPSIPGPTIFPNRTQPRSRSEARPIQDRKPSPPKTKVERMHDLLHGLRTVSQKVNLERIAGIIDTFDWKRGNRSDFLNEYIGVFSPVRCSTPISCSRLIYSRMRNILLLVGDRYYGHMGIDYGDTQRNLRRCIRRRVLISRDLRGYHLQYTGGWDVE
jgi:hypothetical protein